MLAASAILTRYLSGTAAPLSAAIDTFWIVLAVIVGSAVNEWLKKRKQAKGAGPLPMESAPPPSAQRGTTATPTAPPPVATSDWEEALRRLLSGESPLVRPPPSVPPPIRPIIVERPKSSSLRPPIAAPSPASRPAPSLAESSMAEAERAVDVQLAGLKESTIAYERAGRLQEGVAEQLKEIDELTRTHSGRVPMVRRRLYSAEAAQAILMIRNPATARQAVVASLIFGPPQALEGE
jgi:hypothetical protein